jgi:hypothetical protein
VSTHRLIVGEDVLHAARFELPLGGVPPLGGLDDARDCVDSDHLLEGEAAQLLEPREQVAVGEAEQLDRELLGHVHGAAINEEQHAAERRVRDLEHRHLQPPHRREDGGGFGRAAKSDAARAAAADGGAGLAGGRAWAGMCMHLVACSRPLSHLRVEHPPEGLAARGEDAAMRVQRTSFGKENDVLSPRTVGATMVGVRARVRAGARARAAVPCRCGGAASATGAGARASWTAQRRLGAG